MSDDPVKNLPAVIQSRRLRAQELSRPMLGVRMAGDPRYDHAEGGDVADLTTRRAVQYAAEILKRAGELPEDLSQVDAVFDAPATVTFIAADKSQAVLAVYRIADCILNYDPLRLSEKGEEEP